MESEPKKEIKLTPEQELENKMTKMYWSNCLQENGEVDLDKIDGSNDFSVIPQSNGHIVLEVGELLDIVHYCRKVFTKTNLRQP